MQETTVHKDIKVLYVTATTFPEGIQAAMDKLRQTVPWTGDRTLLGISRPENGGAIVYRAGTEEREEGEADRLKCGTLILRKGKYVSHTINDPFEDLSRIGKAFEELLDHPKIDPKGYCVERYAKDITSVECMVRLDQVQPDRN